MEIGGGGGGSSTASKSSGPTGGVEKAPAESASGANETTPVASAGTTGDVTASGEVGKSTIERLSEDSSPTSDSDLSEAVVETAGDISAELTGGLEHAIEEGETVAEQSATQAEEVAAEEAEQLAAEEAAAATIEEALQEEFSNFDADGNGYLTEDEISSALATELAPDHQAALTTLSGRQSFVEEMANDELFDEASGITPSDLAALTHSEQQDAAIMAEQFAIEQRVARAEPVDPDMVDVPADLSAIRGTREYYLERYEDFRLRNPESAAPEYYLDYGLKYFDRFHENKPNMDPITQGWIDRTGMALQVSMEAARAADPAAFAELERQGEAFRQFAYATHPDAYVNSGLHQVPLADRIAISMTPDFEDLANFEGIGQVVETGTRVVGQDITGAGEAVGSGFDNFVNEVNRGILEMIGFPSFPGV